VPPCAASLHIAPVGSPAEEDGMFVKIRLPSAFGEIVIVPVPVEERVVTVMFPVDDLIFCQFKSIV